MSKRWYVIHAYSGFEKQVMRSLNERVKLYAMEEHFGEILVPVEEIVEMRDGKRRKSERKFYPGYVLVEMDMNDQSWHLVNETPRVIGFIRWHARRSRSFDRRKKPTPCCVAFRTVLTSRVRRLSSSRARPSARHRRSFRRFRMASSKKSITKRAVCRSAC